MQISGSPITALVVPAYSSGSNQAESVSRLAASARDKQSDNANREQAQQKSTLQQSDSSITTQILNPHRINRIEPSHNDALSGSTHQAQRAIRTFQQINQLGQTELMNRVDALA